MKRTILLSLILGTVLVVAPAAHAVLLAPEGGGGGIAAAPGGVDPATQAVLLRSEGLANYYNPATQAVILRSKGLADYYGANGVTFHTDVLGGNGVGAATQGSPTRTDSFALKDGGGAAVSLTSGILLALRALAGTRARSVRGGAGARPR